MFVSEEAAAKLARRGITTYDVEQLSKNGALSKRNPRPRMSGSRLLIGPTHGGRILTVVVEPELVDKGALARANRVGRQRRRADVLPSREVKPWRA